MSKADLGSGRWNLLELGSGPSGLDFAAIEHRMEDPPRHRMRFVNKSTRFGATLTREQVQARDRKRMLELEKLVFELATVGEACTKTRVKLLARIMNDYELA